MCVSPNFCRLSSTSHILVSIGVHPSSIPSFSSAYPSSPSSKIQSESMFSFWCSLSLFLIFGYILPCVGTKRELLSRARARAATQLAGNDVIINGLVSISRRLRPPPVVSFKSVHAALQISLFLSPPLPSSFSPVSHVSRTSRTY